MAVKKIYVFAAILKMGIIGKTFRKTGGWMINQQPVLKNSLGQLFQVVFQWPWHMTSTRQVYNLRKLKQKPRLFWQKQEMGLLSLKSY